jgi:VWFA-related protein
MLHRSGLVLCLLLLAAPPSGLLAQADPAITPQTAPPRQDPGLKLRPPPQPKAARNPEGRIHLDVVIRDDSGKPVSGLEGKDFTLFDNNRVEPILSFSARDESHLNQSVPQPAISAAEPPVQIILLIDAVNLPLDQVSFARQQIENYLRQNQGHLAYPTSLFFLTGSGLRVQPRPSVDGNALAAVLDQIAPSLHTIRSSQGSTAELDRFRLSVRQLLSIAENSTAKPGRKLLIWVGPGWPMMESSNFQFSAKDQAGYFHLITELSTRLREARIALYSVSGVTLGAGTLRYQVYLKGVKSASHADTGNLALKVLAEQSGGRVVNPDNDLVGQINNCMVDAGAFYTLSFDPPKTDQPDEYHDMKVVIDKPGMKARTSTGYYNQP